MSLWFGIMSLNGSWSANPRTSNRLSSIYIAYTIDHDAPYHKLYDTSCYLWTFSLDLRDHRIVSCVSYVFVANSSYKKQIIYYNMHVQITSVSMRIYNTYRWIGSPRCLNNSWNGYRSGRKKTQSVWMRLYWQQSLSKKENT